MVIAEDGENLTKCRNSRKMVTITDDNACQAIQEKGANANQQLSVNKFLKSIVVACGRINSGDGHFSA